MDLDEAKKPPPDPIPDDAEPPPGWERYRVTDESGCSYKSFNVRRMVVDLTVQEAWAEYNETIVLEKRDREQQAIGIEKAADEVESCSRNGSCEHTWLRELAEKVRRGDV